MGGDTHGHGHHEPPYKIPDYRIYKVEDVPLLMKTQKALQAQGLHDPWLRNEVWRYDPQLWGTEKSRTMTTFFRGFKWGFAAFVLTMAGTFALNLVKPSKHGRGH